MNNIYDMLIATLKILKSNGSNEIAVKESAKQLVKNQNFAPFHEINLISIIESSKKPDQMISGIMTYIQKIN